MTRAEIEQARAILKVWFPNDSEARHTFNRICDQAVLANKQPPEADDISARVFCLEDALRPFAMQADTMYHLKDDEKVCGMYVAWFRYAAKMMNDSSPPQSG